jgi:hypothetical protein
LLLFTACGSVEERTGVPASSGQEGESVPAETSEAALPESDLKPPPLLLVSEVGTQKAVRGGYCVQVEQVDGDSAEGAGICVDGMRPFPRSVTGVAHGDRVRFVLQDATLSRKGTIWIRPLGCSEREVDKIGWEAGNGQREWTVDLDWGAYQLDVFVAFEAEDGRTGDVSGTLGLTVAGPKKWDALGVAGVRPSDPVCPFDG